MFAIFERGSKSFSGVLLVAILVLAYFSQDNNKGSLGFRDVAASRKNDEDKEETQGREEEGPTILYSRVIGKDLHTSEEKVIETIETIETTTEDKPLPIAQVLFSRIVGKSNEKEKPYKILYSRSFGLKN